MLVVGDRHLALNKSISAQKAVVLTAKNHSVAVESRQEQQSYFDAETRKRYIEKKVGPYGRFAQSHANLAPEIFADIVATPKETPEKRT